MTTGTFDKRVADARAALRELDPDLAPAARLAAALVATPSVNPMLEEGGAGEAEIAALTAGWLERWGFDVSVDAIAPGRRNVVARLRRGRGRGRRLVLNGHLDTVGIAGMTVPPFEARVRDGRLYGRGACDMKAGLAALLAAARDAARGAARGAAPGAGGATDRASGGRAGSSGGREPGFNGELVVALTADEEHASMGMQALVDGGLEADGAVVCEPTGLAIMPAHKGFIWVDVEFRGRAAHGSRPERGVDAIRHAARFITALDGLDARLATRRAHPLLGTGTLHAGTIAGGSAPSVYPAECRLTLERRTLPGETAEAVLAELGHVLEQLRAELPGFDATARLGLVRPGTDVSVGAPVVGALEAALADEGHVAAIAGMTAWVDAAFLNEAGIPAVCFGPGSIEHAHAADESVACAEITAAHAALGRFIPHFLSE